MAAHTGRCFTVALSVEPRLATESGAACTTHSRFDKEGPRRRCAPFLNMVIPAIIAEATQKEVDRDHRPVRPASSNDRLADNADPSSRRLKQTPVAALTAS